MATMKVSKPFVLSELSHPASYPMGTMGLFPWGYSGRGINLTSHLHLVPKLKCVELYLYFPISHHSTAEDASSWRGTWLSTGLTFHLPLLLVWTPILNLTEISFIYLVIGVSECFPANLFDGVGFSFWVDTMLDFRVRHWFGVTVDFGIDFCYVFGIDCCFVTGWGCCVCSFSRVSSRVPGIALLYYFVMCKFLLF